jgi:UDP-2,4-diacetamido-2,4,6-trideoxy-beta-L-altropyranose hydrolase
MLFLIRADASFRIGSGHIMRCLTLAQGIEKEGHKCIWFCRRRPGHRIELLKNRGLEVIELPFYDDSQAENPFFIGGEVSEEICAIKTVIKSHSSDFITFISDHYGIGKDYETRLRPLVQRIFVIDDLQEASHDCDILLNQNYLKEVKYAQLVPRHCQVLLGPKYALLRKEFWEARQKLAQAPGPLSFSKVLVFFGGMDTQNHTLKAVQALMATHEPFSPEVVVGKEHPSLNLLRDLLASIHDAHLHVETQQMAEVMLKCGWYLGSGGTITWERMCLGLTGIVIPVAANQLAFTQALVRDGYQLMLNHIEELNKSLLNKLANQLEFMRHKCMELVDGMGTKRVIQCLLN